MKRKRNKSGVVGYGQHTHDKSDRWKPNGAFTTKWSQKLKIRVLLEDFFFPFDYFFSVLPWWKEINILKMKSAYLGSSRERTARETKFSTQVKEPREKQRGLLGWGARTREETETPRPHSLRPRSWLCLHLLLLAPRDALCESGK